MKFIDRSDAGRQLAQALNRYRGAPDAIVLGLPRGGVPVAYEVATGLQLPLDITCPHKIGAPTNPEYAIAAVTEHGEGLFNERAIRQLGVTWSYLNREVKRRTEQAQRRLNLYRNDPNPRDVSGCIVILVDDGLATGFTMKAAVKSMRVRRAAKVVVAIPVSPPETLAELEALVDELTCLYTPSAFMAVGQFYDDFHETTDTEVIACLKTIIS